MASRSRGFAFIVYPESAPENWREIIDDNHIQWCESPLHCFDVNPTGEIKKEHYHIVLSFEGVKTIDQVKSITESVNGTIPIALNSLRGMVRYMAHLDNPEKYQYPVDQIIGHGGMDVQDLLRMSASARYSVLRKMMDFVAANNITELYQLVDYAADHEYETWFPLLCDSSCYFINQYIKSNKQRAINETKDGMRE